MNVAIGTDSLATTRKSGRNKPELDLFAEMRVLAASDRDVSPPEVLRMATVNGARALGLPGKVGELSPGAFADLIAVPFPGRPADVYEALLHHPGIVAGSMIEGRWIIPPN